MTLTIGGRFAGLEKRRDLKRHFISAAQTQHAKKIEFHSQVWQSCRSAA